MICVYTHICIYLCICVYAHTYILLFKHWQATMFACGYMYGPMDSLSIKRIPDKLYDAYFLSYPLYNIWGCVFSVYPFPLWWLRKYTLCLIIIIKSELWTIINCLVSGHETMVCAVCLYIMISIVAYVTQFFHSIRLTEARETNFLYCFHIEH